MGSLTTELRSCNDYDVRSEVSIPLGYDCYDDTHSNDLEVSSDPLSSFVHASPLETSTSLDTSEDASIIPNPSHPLAPLGELNEGDSFETDASFDDQYMWHIS